MRERRAQKQLLSLIEVKGRVRASPRFCAGSCWAPLPCPPPLSCRSALLCVMCAPRDSYGSPRLEGRRPTHSTLDMLVKHVS